MVKKSDSRNKRITITKRQAEQAFNRFYSGKKPPVRVSGKNKGQDVFASTRGRRWAKTFDIRHERPDQYVITDARYLKGLGPYRYDFPGVDTGSIKSPITRFRKGDVARVQKRLQKQTDQQKEIADHVAGIP